MKTDYGFLKGKVVLVTGGTGSFGKAFAKRLLRTEEPKAIRIFSRDELKQHYLQKELNDPRVNFLLGDVRDRDRLYRAFRGVDVVVHAAALKQVPAAEYNPFEAVRTNIIGTMNVIDAAIDCGVERVMVLSTDKAVHPVNLYGATKMCAERLVVQSNTYSGGTTPRFSCVRYGNVVGSRGSVIPLFLEQKKTGELTITHEDMTRFWITLDHAVDLVLHALGVMEGGEIFVPKLPSMHVMELANVIASGSSIRIIGIRPGEKIHEALLTDSEARHTVEADEYYVVKPLFNFWKESNWKDLKPLATDFRYSSDLNSAWLTKNDFQTMVEDFVLDE